jgi:hypothetical protein
LSEICTPNGINLNAIGDEQLLLSLTISEAYKKGLFTLELDHNELSELDFPTESRVERLTKQFVSMWNPESNIPKRKISKYIHMNILF